MNREQVLAYLNTPCPKMQAIHAEVDRVYAQRDALAAQLAEIDELAQAGLNSAEPAHWEAALQDIRAALALTQQGPR